MQFGKLRHSITIKVPTVTKDAHAHAIRTYSHLVTVRADVRGTYGVEGEYAERIESRTIFRVVTRYRNDIFPQYRIAWNDCGVERELEITSVMDMRGDKRMLTMIAIEVTGS